MGPGGVTIVLVAADQGALGAGCSDDAPGAVRCVPGKAEACPRGRGVEATQVCLDDGTLGPRRCGEVPAWPGEPGGNDDLGGAGLGGAGLGGAAAAVEDVPETPEVGLGPELPGDTAASRACEPCGMGELLGVVCAPSERAFVTNASIQIFAEGCGGVVQLHETHSGPDGSDYFPALPCGTHAVQVSAGSLSASCEVDIEVGETTDLTGTGKTTCIKAAGAKIGAWWGQWDEQEELLDALGFDTTFHGAEGALSSDVLYEDVEAIQILRTPDALAEYDILLFNCGSAAADVVDQFPDVTDNLEQFVLGGGSRYASDLSWAYVEAALPDAIDFYGPGALGERDDGPQQVAGNQTAPATIDDLGPQACADTSSLSAWYGPGPLVAVQSPGAGTTVHVKGFTTLDAPEPRGGVLQGPDITHAGPMVLSFKPGPLSGSVVCTTLHRDGQADDEQAGDAQADDEQAGDEQADELMHKILSYLVFVL